MSFQLITISGMLGSGKSTIAKMLAKKLNYAYFSTGDVQRELALKYGITITELNQLALSDPSIDRQIDKVFQTKSYANKDYIVDSRLAFFFLPESLKIKLDVDTNVAGQRIFEDHERIGESPYQTVDQAIDTLKKRRSLERERFKRVYGVDIDNTENFDFILDTTYLSPDQVCDTIIQHFGLTPANRL